MGLRAPLGAALAVLLLAASPARAADQVVTDPDDAYASGSQGQSDLRAVEWHTSGTDITAVLRVDYSSSIVAFAFLDVDRNGRADYALSVDGGSASSTFDAKLRPVGPSTTACQLHDAGAPPTVSQQPSVTKDADGFLVLPVTFPASAIGGAGSFTWAAFGLTLDGSSTRGWDYAPDASNPNPAGPQPGDRSCTVDQTPGAGVGLSLRDGIAFPTPAPANTPPVASFTFAPAAPRSGDTVTFTSTSSDAQGPLVSQRWDLDGDGQFDDAAGASVEHGFTRRGPHAVGLLVEDSGGAITTTSLTVPVGNRPPVVSVRLPSEPVFPDRPLRLESTSTDDGTIAAYAWDLDDDGAFDDATGAIVSATYPRKGPHRVRLRATDDDGAASEGEVIAQVANRPPVLAVRAVPARIRLDAADGALIDPSGSSDPDGDPLTFAYVLPDSREWASGPTHRYFPRGQELGPRVIEVVVGDGTATARASVTVDVLAPAPPVPILSTPDTRAVVLNGTARVAGRIDHASHLLSACITVGAFVMPADCDDPLLRRRAGGFANVPVTLRPGINRVTLWARDRYGQVASAVTEVEAASASSGLDLRASMIEVTQGTQWATSSRLRDITPGAARLSDYTGVRLARGGPTFARVFANARSLARGRRLPQGVTVVLEGYSRSGRLPGGPLLPLSGPASLREGPTWFAPPTRARRDPAGAYTFELPDAWTRHPELRLDATVDPAGVFPECATCRRDNTESLRWIPFVPPPPVSISPVRLVPSPTAPRPAFRELSILRRIYPGGSDAVTIQPYRATLNIASIIDDPTRTPDGRSLPALLAVAAYESSNPSPGLSLGVYSGGTIRGMALPVPLPSGIEPVAVADTTRPITSIAHEIGHGLGQRHASQCSRPATASDPGTGDPGGFLGVLAEGWFPDEQGFLQGYALDLRPGSGGALGPFRVLHPTDYDLMSYCAHGDADTWLSPRNWNRRLGGPGDQDPPRTSRAVRADVATTGVLSVFASVEGAADARIVRVQPQASGVLSPPAAGAEFRVIVRRADGAIASDTPVAAPDGHVDGAGGRARIIVATVAAGAGAARVELVTATGAPLDARRASPSAPEVVLGRPRVAGGAVRVGWTARDADGDGVLARVDVAEDGRRFRTVALDVPRPPARIALAGLAGGPRARVRVTVSDGFRETSAVSAPFRLPSGGTDVQIIDPEPRSVLTSEAAVVLRSQALTAAGKRVGVTWWAGRRRLGRGRVLTVQGLPAGRVTLRAVAPDGTADRVRVRVRGARPRLTALKAPRRLSRRARTVTLRAAAATPTVLRVAGRRFALTRSPRAVRVRVRPGSTPLTLVLRLSAGGRSSTQGLAIPRR